MNSAHPQSHRTLLTALFTAALLAIAQPGAAQPAGGGADMPTPATAGGAAGGEIGFGQIDEDFFVNLELHFTFGLPVPKLGCAPDEDDCLTRLRFGILAPLRLRVIDREPKQDSILREEDWSEFSDYLRIIRFIEYGFPHEPLYVRLGELGPAVLGHGTIVNGYYNVITTDHYQLGSQLNVNTVYGGVETLINNLAGPHVLGMRLYVRPWAFIDRESWWNRLAVGTSIVSDIDAPLDLGRDTDGSISVGAHQRPQVTRSQATTLAGLDVELNLVRTSMFSVTPYSDLNHHFGIGPGWHNGVLTQFWPTESLGLFARLEHRTLSGKYLPDYIGPLYEIDRFQFPGWSEGLPAPKLRVAATREDGLVQGVFGSATANVFGLISAGLAYEDYQGPNNSSLRLRLSLTPTQAMQLGVFYFKGNFDSFDEIFELDKAMLVTEARVPISGPLYLKAQYSRLWRLEDDGRYTTVNDWNVGVGVSFAL
ncbi:MAG: hypothetical protein H0U74_12905 [Bradymonadaceae bacterium]|nr:hypothetical protein [Lujinxingiaceae bacterium]